MAIRRQADVISPGGDIWEAWKLDSEDDTFYIQETDGEYHVLKQAADGYGWWMVGHERAQEVIAAFEAARALAA